MGLLLVLFATPALADDSQLAKDVSNPIANLISVPFQFNYDCCIGPSRGGQLMLNVQPVIPIKLSADWTLITRTIVPVIDQQPTVPGMSNRFGLGDSLQSFFLSPKPTPGGFMWGAGPVFLWPTGTDALFTSRKWGAGPTVVLLEQESGWTFGILANHYWSYAGPKRFPDVSTTTAQPFVAYQWPDTTTLTFTSETTYDWTGHQGTVPLDFLISHIYRLGSQPLSVQIGPRYFPVTPSQGTRWGARLNIVFLFPA